MTVLLEYLAQPCIQKPTSAMIRSIYAPVNVKPHLPQVGRRVGISRGLSHETVPRVGAFVKHIKGFSALFVAITVALVFLTTFGDS